MFEVTDNRDKGLYPSPALPSLLHQAAAGYPFAVPWSVQEVSILNGFESKYIPSHNGPWMSTTPFDISAKNLEAVIIHDPDGGSVSYREAESTRAYASTEHYSASLGVTVSIPFVSANVTAKYDKKVQQNDTGIQASRNISCRLGRIILNDTPKLSEQALQLLSSKDGARKFRELYGDFFVQGYIFGIEAGACLSATTHERSQKDRVELSITVKILWAKISKSVVKESSSYESQATLNFSAYNTLNNTCPSYNVMTTSISQVQYIQKMIDSELKEITEAETAARQRVEELGFEPGKTMSLDKAAKVCKSGLVVSILLFPYARLVQYVSAVPEGTVQQLRDEMESLTLGATDSG